MSAPTPIAPSLGELFELALIGLLDAPGTFFKLSERPAPGPFSSLLVALTWGVAFFALNVVHLSVAKPGALAAYPAWMFAAVGGAGLALWTLGFLVGAGIIYGLGRALGSGGDFDRALTVAAFTLAAAPLQALCNWFPAAWVVPTLVAAWIAACGIAASFKADAWALRGVCAGLAGVALVVQYGAGFVVEKYANAAKFAAAAAQSAPSPEQLDDLQKQLQQAQVATDLARQTIADAQTPGQSSLDLLRGPGGEAPAAAPSGPTQKQQLAQMSAAGDAMNKNVLGMIDSMAPMLDNPAITQNMSPQQKTDFVELKKMVADLRGGIASNSITSPAEQQAKMMKIQGMVMRLVSAGMTMQSPAAAGAKKK